MLYTKWEGPSCNTAVSSGVRRGERGVISGRSLLHMHKSQNQTRESRRGERVESKNDCSEVEGSWSAGLESRPALLQLQLAVVEGREGDKGRRLDVICLALCFVLWYCKGFQADKRRPGSPESPGWQIWAPLLYVHFLWALYHISLTEAVRKTFHPSGPVNQDALSDSTEKIKWTFKTKLIFFFLSSANSKKTKEALPPNKFSHFIVSFCFPIWKIIFPPPPCVLDQRVSVCVCAL